MTTDATRATAEAMPEPTLLEAIVPFAGQEPINEMDGAIARLRTLRLAMRADSQRLANYDMADAEFMVGEVLDQLDPIRAFLAENDFEDVDMSFLECRHRWFSKKDGAK